MGRAGGGHRGARDRRSAAVGCAAGVGACQATLHTRACRGSPRPRVARDRDRQDPSARVARVSSEVAMIPADRPELAELRDAVRSLLAKAAPLADVERHGALPGGYERALWRRLAAEIGAAALLVPEKCDGVGAGIQEAAVVAEELGRALVPSPFLITAGLAALLLQDSPDAGGLLAKIAAGKATAAVVYRGADGEVDPAALPVRAREAADAAAGGTGWRLDGK